VKINSLRLQLMDACLNYFFHITIALMPHFNKNGDQIWEL